MRVFLNMPISFSPLPHFYIFFKERPEFPLAMIVHWRFTTKRYCFTEAACLPALYIKRARANIILLWIFMGTERPPPILFASRLKRAISIEYILRVFHIHIFSPLLIFVNTRCETLFLISCFGLFFNAVILM